MRFHKEIQPMPTIDGIADVHDQVVVRIEERGVAGMVLYVDVNGATVLRLGHIRQHIEITDGQPEPAPSKEDIGG